MVAAKVRQENNENIRMFPENKPLYLMMLQKKNTNKIYALKYLIYWPNDAWLEPSRTFRIMAPKDMRHHTAQERFHKLKWNAHIID